MGSHEWAILIHDAKPLTAAGHSAAVVPFQRSIVQGYHLPGHETRVGYPPGPFAVAEPFAIDQIPKTTSVGSRFNYRGLTWYADWIPLTRPSFVAMTKATVPVPTQRGGT
jgi:hypothetical protein